LTFLFKRSVNFELNICADRKKLNFVLAAVSEIIFKAVGLITMIRYKPQRKPKCYCTVTQWLHVLYISTSESISLSRSER